MNLNKQTHFAMCLCIMNTCTDAAKIFSVHFRNISNVYCQVVSHFLISVFFHVFVTETQG